MGTLFNKYAQTIRRMDLRLAATSAEKCLWFYLREKQLGYKFRRQHGIGAFILDFYCSEKMLGIEIDGPSHLIAEAAEKDKARTELIASHQIKIIRFTNEEIYKNIQTVISTIIKELETRPIRPQKYLSPPP